MQILKTYTPEQLITFCRDSIIADNVGITSFNKGDVLYSLLQSFCVIHSQAAFDFADAVRKAIRFAGPIGLGFARKGAASALGRTVVYRTPEFEIRYTGAATSVLLDRTATDFILTTASVNVPADDISLDFVTYPTIQDLIDEINTYPNWSATLIANGSLASTGLYAYSGQEIIGINRHNEAAFDVMAAAAALIPVLSGFRTLVGGTELITTENSEISAGLSASAEIRTQAVVAGALRFPALTLDIENSKGIIETPISGVQYSANYAAFAPGTDIESDVDFLTRFAIYVNGLAVHNKIGIESAVLKIDGIRSVTILINFPTAGFITVVADDGSGVLTADQDAEIRKTLDGDPDDIDTYPGVLAAGITGIIAVPIVVPVPVVVELEKLSNSTDSATIIIAAQTAIEEYINTRKLGEAVIVSEMVTRIKNANPEIYDAEVLAPSPDLCDQFRRLLIASDSIARTGGAIATVTVTVV